MKNWRTTIFGILTIGSYVAGKFFPEYQSFIDGLIPVLIGLGLISARDGKADE